MKLSISNSKINYNFIYISKFIEISQFCQMLLCASYLQPRYVLSVIVF